MPDNKDKTGGKGPDNNKRLAELEAGVSSLAMALAENGMPLKEGEDPIAVAIVSAKARAELAGKIAELDATIASHDEQTKLLAAAIVEHTDEPIGEAGVIPAAIAALEKADGNGATTGELAAIARAEAAEKRVAELEAVLADVDKAQGVDPTPAPEPRERSSAARDVGPTYGQLEPQEISEAIDEGDELELVFSNGDYEIVDFEPITLTAKDLPVMAGKRQVANPVYVRGGGNDDQIHGAGLLIDGVQIAYCSFPAPIPIEKGQERRFERAISFG